ncbi:MAG: hypothetical protein ABSF26_16805 [Thermoguttaceae bacterium]|jgi:hypothetical protein
MARESQGLQIALIIFVMLTIVLIVTTFLYHSRYTEAEKKVKDTEQAAAKERQKTGEKETENADLRRIIGLAEKSGAEIREQFDKDMKAYGSNFPDEARFYSPILKRLWDTVEDRTKELADSKQKLKDLAEQFAQREAAKDATIKQFQDAVNKAGADVKTVSEDFAKSRGVILQDQKNLLAERDKLKTSYVEKIGVAQAEVKVAKENANVAAGIVVAQGKQLEGYLRPTMDVPAGEITYVNQHNRTVSINLGQADALERQTTFNVYSANPGDISKAVKKATIEVTNVSDGHSEARIVEDKNADPITPGDKIHTPLWRPGERTHYALAGFMDLDGNGRNAVSTVRNLIIVHGGAVDCWLNEQWKRTGEMNANTRYLVVGDEPVGRGSPEALEAFTLMNNEAQKLNIHKMPLSELKQKMGYQRTGTVERFGAGAPADVGPRPVASGAKAAPAGGAAKRRTPPKVEGGADQP